MRIDLNDMFNDYIVGKRAAYDAPRGSYNEGYLFGEAHDMENWFNVFGVDLEYWTIQQMIAEKAEVRLPLKAGDGRTGLTVSVLHRRDYSGTDDVNVHFSRNSADETVKNEMAEICGKLSEEGYTPVIIENKDHHQVVAREQDGIYYEWSLYDTDVRL